MKVRIIDVSLPTTFTNINKVPFQILQFHVTFP